MRKSIDTVIREALGHSFDPDTLYFIVVQGASESGKTTYTKNLEGALSNSKKLHVHIIHIDSFFDFKCGSKEDEEGFDFDNPATIRWDAIDCVIGDIISKKPKIPVYERSKGLDEPSHYINNPGFNVILVDGLYSFNCLSKNKFNIKEFDPFNSHKTIHKEYIQNENYDKLREIKSNWDGTKSKYKDVKVLNIRFPTCFTRLSNIRIQRDEIMRKLTFNEVFPRICNFIWPATIRWVYSERFNCDIDVQHGNFNPHAIKNISNSLFTFFNISEVEKDLEIPKVLKNTTNIKCLRGCDDLKDSGSLYLADSENNN